MPTVVRDTLSLRPQGFYAYAFLAARIAQIISLGVITGIAGHFIFITTRGTQQKDPAATLIALLILSSAALLWSLLSWTGYSRRYLPYAATCCADLVFAVPLVILTIVLGLPLADVQCGAVAPNAKFEIVAPPGSSFGKIAFATDGRTACVQLLAVWGLLIAVCVLFVASALSVGFLDLGERQLRKAIFAVREESGGGGDGLYYAQGGNGSGGRRFAPTPATQPGGAWGAGRDGRQEVDEYNNFAVPPRPSVAEDRLNLNWPITVAPARNRAVAGGMVYDEQLGIRGAWSKRSGQPPDGGGRESARGTKRGDGEWGDSDSNNGVIPVASLPSQSASFGKAPRTYQQKEKPSDNKREDWMGATPTTSWPKRGSGNVPGTPSRGFNESSSPHDSLMPKPLAVGQSRKSSRQKAKEDSTESGWWGALASVIYRPQEAYDPSNVV
ncbi:hypothetical protein C8A00DRAFT_41319 [Chaetomidium leptoderma]|uniref:MARVEL domain-containing protein n=1 Tax=Chaetomidium leptoderma TaxID=669021 RepID=A0AAN6VRQ4_9PEZI|nr:hypothetical protein C8A00DRAFT_41319 [Chaetomidium leptoderma]